MKKENILNIVESLRDDMFEDFKRLVNINSFSENLEGIERVYEAITEIGEREGLKFEKIKNQRVHLMLNRELKEGFYGFIGHIDTVHKKDNGFDKIEEFEDRFRGPGTNDMKSGIIVALYSLVVLKRVFEGDLPIKVLFNSDEEIGSFDSKDTILNDFKNASAGFVFEPGRLENKIVTSRKGVLGIDVEFFGKASHAGVEPQNGKNAIVSAAYAIEKLDKLNDFENGVSVSCNVIEGGEVRNTIADYCKLLVDCRYVKPSQFDELSKNFKKIFGSPDERGVEIKYEVVHHRPPFVKTKESERLFNLYKSAYKAIGKEVSEVGTGGGSDANFLSSIGVASLDGVGGIGDHSHTLKEYVLKESIPERVKVFTLFMSDLLSSQKGE